MFYVSEIKKTAPKKFQSGLQKKVYQTLEELKVPYERVDTDEAITMNDCIAINERLEMDMVKTLFLCNKKKTIFYLFVTPGEKHFDTREFCNKLGISRVSFAPQDVFEELLETKIGAVTVYSALIDWDKSIQIVMDEDVVNSEFYGCSDGTTTGYMKVKTSDILEKVLPYSKHRYTTLSME